MEKRLFSCDNFRKNGKGGFRENPINIYAALDVRCKFECLHASVRVRPGDSPLSPVFRRLCPAVPPENWKSTGN